MFMFLFCFGGSRDRVDGRSFVAGLLERGGSNDGTVASCPSKNLPYICGSIWNTLCLYLWRCLCLGYVLLP